MVVLCVTRNWFNIRMIRPFKRVECSAACLVPYGKLTRDCLVPYIAYFYLFYRIRTKVHMLVDPIC
jgi:hypothetical protein